MEIDQEADDNKKNKRYKIKEEPAVTPPKVKGGYKKTKCTTRGGGKKTTKEATKPATTSKRYTRGDAKKTMEEEVNQESEEENEEDEVILYKNENEEEQKRKTRKRKLEKVEETDEEKDEEEDEEERHIVNVKKEKIKKEKEKKRTKKVTYPSCLTRSSPKAMSDAMVGLTEMRKKVLKDIGFERFINFPITELPGALLYHVAEKFHPPSMELRLEKGSIKVTRQKIHDMLGVPMGKTKLEDLEPREKDDPFIAEWEGQFTHVKKITPAVISTEITSSFDADFIFTINFLTLFASTMGTVDNGAKVFPTVLMHVKENDVISEIDWCGYILECLRASKQNWDKVTKGDYYYGPATFLCVSYFTCFYKFIKCDSITYTYYNLTQIYILYEKAAILRLNQLPQISSNASSPSNEKLEHASNEEEDWDGNDRQLLGKT